MEPATVSWKRYLKQSWRRLLRGLAIFAVVFYLDFWAYLFLFVGPPQEHLFSYIVTPGAFIVIVIFAVIPVWSFLGPPKSEKEGMEQES